MVIVATGKIKAEVEDWINVPGYTVGQTGTKQLLSSVEGDVWQKNSGNIWRNRGVMRPAMAFGSKTQWNPTVIREKRQKSDTVLAFLLGFFLRFRIAT